MGAQAIKGYRAEEIIGRHFSIFYPQESIERGWPAHELKVATAKGRFEDEGWRVRKDGSRFWANVAISAVRDRTGKLVGFSNVTRDLTDGKHVQALEASARNVNEFIAVLAHELRNPLAPIQSAVQVLQMPGLDPARREHMTAIVRRQSAQLRRIVDDMLDITRVTRGELTLARTTTNLTHIVRNATESIAMEAACREHRVDLDFASESLSVNGDPQRLTQLVMNLLDNACKYTPRGGRIVVRTEFVDGAAQLTVTDDGRGIDPAAITDIFEMFVRRSPVLERAGGGLGIGLALSRKIAEMHGGSLSAASDGLGKGSVFSFRVPIVSEQTAAPTHDIARQPIPEPGNTKVERILIVDDNADAAETLNVLLTSFGYTTLVAETGIEALGKVPDFRPDVILLDIGLPGIDGYEVARRLRASHMRRAVKIIAVTGWGSPADKEKSREAGIDVHLVKPIDSDDLRGALENGASLH